MNVSIEEVAMLLGVKDIEIHSLQKQIAELQKRITELEKPPEAQP